MSLRITHLMSGGLDSTVLLYDIMKAGHSVHCIGFNYGQRHIKELQYARKHCARLKVEFTQIDLLQVKHLFSRSVLTDGEGTVVVPNRNAVFLHIAAGIAASTGGTTVTIACNRDDQSLFPDCTHPFLKGMRETLKAAGVDVEIIAPYIGMTKWQIVQMAKKNRWPWEDTWSCYAGGIKPCGTCQACIARKGAK